MPTAVRTSSARGGGGSVAAPVPFLRAAHEHTESIQLGLISAAPGATVVTSVQVPVTAYGYLRSIALIVSTSGGTVGSAALAADAPWNVIQSAQLFDTNGSPITAPMSGYDLYLMNKYCSGMASASDPQVSPDYSNGAITFAFIVRIPVEIVRSLGALPNQNAAAPYKLQVSLNTTANIWSVAPTANPTVTIDAWLEAWSKPAPQSPTGRGQAVAPPRTGTTQRFWLLPGNNLVAGSGRVQVTQVGNLIRTLIFVIRTAGGARQTLANMPNPVELWWDNRQQFSMDIKLLRKYMAERVTQLGNAGYTGPENGVIVFDYSHDVTGQMGMGTDLWLPTVQATRLELRASNFVAGSVDIIVNDVTPVEIAAGARYTETSASSFHPQVGTQSPVQP